MLGVDTGEGAKDSCDIVLFAECSIQTHSLLVHVMEFVEVSTVEEPGGV